MGYVIVLWFVQNRFQFDTSCLSLLYFLALGCFRLLRFLLCGMCLFVSQVRLSLIQNVSGGCRSFLNTVWNCFRLLFIFSVVFGCFNFCCFVHVQNRSSCLD